MHLVVAPHSLYGHSHDSAGGVAVDVRPDAAEHLPDERGCVGFRHHQFSAGHDNRLTCASPIFRPPCESPRRRALRGPKRRRVGLPITLTTRLHRERLRTADGDPAAGERMVSHCLLVAEPDAGTDERNLSPYAVGPLATAHASAGPGRCFFACLYGRECDLPSFINSPWIRGAPQRRFSKANGRIRARHCESMHGLPGRRERRRQHRRNPSRCQRSTVAGWTSNSASLHRGHNRRKNSQSRRSDGQRADSNERVRPTGGAGQDSRAGGLYASTRLTGPQRPSGRRHASPVEWPVAAPTSNDFGSDAILARDKPPRSVPSRRDRS